MKKALKMMAVAFVLFAFAGNVSAATLSVAGVTKCVSVDQDGNGGVKVKKNAAKTKKNAVRIKNLVAKTKKNAIKIKKLAAKKEETKKKPHKKQNNFSFIHLFKTVDNRGKDLSIGC